MIRGWTAVIVFTTLAVVMMVGVNVRMWRRMKAATAAAKADAEREGEGDTVDRGEPASA
ncbi:MULTISPECIES: hypothetical protein [unclassified Sphingomonas]|uniref:hypothetical protein n=1 Tax=unclassified Sphingomonas TaxID=196159 RepID=UPI002858EC74|nr:MULTISPECIES: hypothetical protein [unclassified Sphingomonas]MDR6116292.1 hypothetical protein [Sphingomonas sp. SORGH_AS_0789]MDR6150033.1 hypothetical protein [Sphingomonas sp. SORGH_AS_0742]